MLAEPQPKMIVSASAPQRQYAGAVSLTPELSFGEQLASPVASAIIRPSQARGYFTPYARVYMVRTTFNVVTKFKLSILKGRLA